MGNCIRKDSPMVWAGEDWGSSASETLLDGDKTHRLYGKGAMEGGEEEEKLLGGKKGNLFPSSSTTATEVKIKITKKQLEELLGKVEVQDSPVQQVLTQLMSVGVDLPETHQRPWKPALQSIPEVN